MARRLWILLLIAALLGCSKKEEAAMEPAAEMAAAPAPASGGAPAAKTSAPETRRYMAVSHYIELETEPTKLKPVWTALQVQASKLGGEIVTAELANSDRDNPSATLSVRLPPANVNAFLATLGQSGRLLTQRTNSEDKTDEVIDVDARIKNLADTRDQLRRMLSERTGKLSDVLEVQKALTETQSQLDSLTGQRKALARLTDMVRLDITLTAPRGLAERGVMAPLADAWHDVGHLMVDSLAAVLRIVAVALPWLVVFSPVIWAFRRWRRRKSRKPQADH